MKPRRKATWGFVSRRTAASCLLSAAVAFLSIGAGGGALAQDSTQDDARLQKWLERYPQADANGDGILTLQEARAYMEKAQISKTGQSAQTKKGVQAMKPKEEGAELDKEETLIEGETAQAGLAEAPPHQTEMIPMRDGVRLATDIYLPEGNGPWPVVVVRTPYNRKSEKQWGKCANYTSLGYGFVVQDLRGLFDSEGQFGSLAPQEMQSDGYDTIEWVARQPWCNGKVGVTGGSGPGIAAKMTVVSNPPHLVAAVTSVASTRPSECTGFNGGVQRTLSQQWSAKRGVANSEWPKPHLPKLRNAEDSRSSPAATPTIAAAVHDSGGWYDIFSQGTLDDFATLDNGKWRVVMMGKGHGRNLQALEYPPQNLPDNNAFEWFDYWLKGTDNGVMKTPPMRYFLMGDTMSPGAPGNVWKQADRWPIPNTPACYYFTRGGGLETTPPSEKDAKLTYAYDPRNPVPTVGGANLGAEQQGPMDQRTLQDRADILRFASAPLGEPLEVTGKVFVELFVDTDVPDTTFMAKLIDIYPNGYEALTLDSAIMARYWNGFDNPAPLEKEKIYKLTIDLFSTALVFNKGHRIGVQIASSNSPRFEVHPNSFEPVNSYDNALVAHSTVHVSAEHASRLILPVIAPGVSKDYAPQEQLGREGME